MDNKPTAAELLGDLANLTQPKHRQMLEDAVLDTISIGELQGLRGVLLEETRLMILANYNQKVQRRRRYERRLIYSTLGILILALSGGLLFFWNQYQLQQDATHIQQQEALCLENALDSLKKDYAQDIDKVEMEKKRVFWAKAKAEAASRDKQEDFKEAQANNWAFMADDLSKQGMRDKALRLSEAAYKLNKRNPPTSVLQALSNAYFGSDEFHFAQQMQHRGPVRHLAVSPNGRYIATASNDHTAKIWNTEGKMLANLGKHSKTVLYVAFSPDSKFLLTASEDETAILWSVDGQAITTLQGHHDDVRMAVFSPDGKTILTASFDQTAKLWSTSGKLLKTLEGHSNAVEQAIFSPSGKEVLTASWDHTCKLWSVATGKEILTLSQHSDKINSIAFDPKGKAILTASEDGEAILWDVKGEVLTTFSLHNDAVKTACFSPNGRQVLTSSADKTAMIWNRDGQPVQRLSGHAFGLVTASFSPNGQYILTGATDNVLRLWYKDGTLIYEYKGHLEQMTAAQFFPNGQKMVSTAYDQSCRTWLTPSGIMQWMEEADVRDLTDEEKKMYGFEEEMK